MKNYIKTKIHFLQVRVTTSCCQLHNTRIFGTVPNSLKKNSEPGLTLLILAGKGIYTIHILLFHVGTASANETKLSDNSEFRGTGILSCRPCSLEVMNNDCIPLYCKHIYFCGALIFAYFEARKLILSENYIVLIVL